MHCVVGEYCSAPSLKYSNHVSGTEDPAPALYWPGLILIELHHGERETLHTAITASTGQTVVF